MLCKVVTGLPTHSVRSSRLWFEKFPSSKATSVKSIEWYSPRLTGQDRRVPFRTRHRRTLSRPHDTILKPAHPKLNNSITVQNISDYFQRYYNYHMIHNQWEYNFCITIFIFNGKKPQYFNSICIIRKKRLDVTISSTFTFLRSTDGRTYLQILKHFYKHALLANKIIKYTAKNTNTDMRGTLYHQRRQPSWCGCPHLCVLWLRWSTLHLY